MELLNVILMFVWHWCFSLLYCTVTILRS